MRRLFQLLTLTAALLSAGTCVQAAGAGPAGTSAPRMVVADPADWTPHVTDGEVWAMAVIGDTVVVGGAFSGASAAADRTPVSRRNLMAFSLSTGAISALRVELDGPVFALAEGPDGSLLIGGAFSSVNGRDQRSLARIDLATGQSHRGFHAPIDGDVRTLAVHGAALYVGGRYQSVHGVARAGLARLDAASGRLDQRFDAGLADAVNSFPRAQAMSLTPDGAQLAVLGNFATAQGHERQQLVMLDVTGPQAVVTDWSTDFYGVESCDPRFDSYVRGIDHSPDGRYFVVVTTGHDSGVGLPCTTAARFETAGPGPHTATWVNHTGGHSLFAVAATGPAVYVGGHQRWQDNPEGHKTKGPGAVDRPGIAALDPATGRALAWNPTRTRGEGVRAFVTSRRGLLVGSDTDQLGHEYHGRIGLFPYAPAGAPS